MFELGNVSARMILFGVLWSFLALFAVAQQETSCAVILTAAAGGTSDAEVLEFWRQTMAFIMRSLAFVASSAVTGVNSIATVPPILAGEVVVVACQGGSMPPPPAPLPQMIATRVTSEPGPNDIRMLLAVRSMYTMLGQILFGGSAFSATSMVERTDAAYSLVCKTSSTLRRWRASAEISALLQPAMDATELLSPRTKRHRSSDMIKALEARHMALLHRTADTMEEVISQSLWARTMPVVPTDLQDAVLEASLSGRRTRDGSVRPDSSIARDDGATTSRNPRSKSKAACVFSRQ